jgi:hypothetical protein
MLVVQYFQEIHVVVVTLVLQFLFYGNIKGSGG